MVICCEYGIGDLNEIIKNLFFLKYLYRNEFFYFVLKDVSFCYFFFVIWWKDMFFFGSLFGYNMIVFSLVILVLWNCLIVLMLCFFVLIIFMMSWFLLVFEFDFEIFNWRVMLLIFFLMYGFICCYRNLESVWFDGIGKLYFLMWFIKVCLVIDVMKDDLKLNVCCFVCICVLLELVGVGVFFILEVFVFFVYVVR